MEKKINNTNGYDKKLMSTLLAAAKGPKRTGAKFCEESGISTPTFSRHLNMRNVRPCTKEFLRKVADHADPDSGVTFEKLLAANGGIESFNEEINRTLSDIEILALLSTPIIFNHYQCERAIDRDNIDILGLTYHPSLSIRTNALDGKSLKIWDIFTWEQYSKSDVIEADRLIRQLLTIISAVHLKLLELERLSFVFFRSILYKTIIKRVKNLSLDMCVSFILINSDKRTIQNEYFIPCQKDNLKSFLSMASGIPTKESTLLSIDEHNLM